MESELLENKMGCGHPRACWVEDKDSLSHLDSFYRKQIDKGMFNEDQIDSLKRDNSYCTVCAELSRVRQQARAEERASHILVDPCSRWTTDDVVKKLQEVASKVAHTTYPKWEDGTTVDICTVDCPHCAIVALIPAEAQGAPKESK